MPYYSVIEGEGVAGPLNAVSAETTALSSCTGIVFHSRRRAHAGLYHYGANTLHYSLTQRTILNMLNDLQPDRICFTAPPVAASYGSVGSTRTDRNEIDLFFLEHASAATLQWMPDQVWSNYRLVGGNFAVNDANDIGDGIPRPTQLRVSRGRLIEGSTIFYGGRRPGAKDDSVLLAARRQTGRNVFG